MSEPLIAVQRAIDFVEERLREEIAVADMAAAAGYSLFHFARQFNRVVHQTPYDYLVRRRLSESALELVRSDKKIIDLALEYHFHSPEVYSRAFKRMFGLQPSEYRSIGAADPRFLLARRTAAHLQHFLHPGFHPPARVEWEAVTLVGLMTRVHNECQDRANLWETLRRALHGSQFPGAGPRFYGVFAYPAGWEDHGPFYLAGAVVSEPVDFRLPLVSQSLPAGEYACFHHPGPARSLPLTRDYIYQTWLPRSGMQLANSMEIEFYGQGLPGRNGDPAGWQVYLQITKNMR